MAKIRKIIQFLFVFYILSAYGTENDTLTGKVENPIYSVPIVPIKTQGEVVKSRGECLIAVRNFFNPVEVKVGDEILDGTRVVVPKSCNIKMVFKDGSVLDIQDSKKDYDVVFKLK